MSVNNNPDASQHIEIMHYTPPFLDIERALRKAVCEGELEAVQSIIKTYEIDINQQDNTGFSLLHYAARVYGRPEMVTYLIQEGAEIDQPSNPGHFTPLFLAARHSDSLTVQTLGQAGANVDHITRAGQTPLISASRTDESATVDYLIRRGATLDLAPPPQYQSALHEAALLGRLQAIQVLVRAGATIDLTSEALSSTPLRLAASEGRTRSVEYLLARGADAQFCVPPHADIDLEGERNPYVRDIEVMLWAASYDPWKEAHRGYRPRPQGSLRQEALIFQTKHLFDAVSRSLIGIQAEVHAILTAATTPGHTLGSEPSLDTIRFTAWYAEVPTEVQLEISKCMARCAIRAIIEDPTQAPDPLQRNQWTWMKAAAEGRPVLPLIRLFPKNVRKQALASLDKDHPNPSNIQLARINKFFPQFPQDIPNP